MKCALCQAVNESYRLIERTDTVYSIIPIAPLIEGHAMVLPIRHTTMENLTQKELVELNQQLNYLKDCLKLLYPLKHPMIVTTTDTAHSSIPDHFHYHLIPSEVKFSNLMAAHNPKINKNRQEAEISELERMAKILRR